MWGYHTHSMLVFTAQGVSVVLVWFKCVHVLIMVWLECVHAGARVWTLLLARHCITSDTAKAKKEQSTRSHRAECLKSLTCAIWVAPDTRHDQQAVCRSSGPYMDTRHDQQVVCRSSGPYMVAWKGMRRMLERLLPGFGGFAYGYDKKHERMDIWSKHTYACMRVNMIKVCTWRVCVWIWSKHAYGVVLQTSTSFTLCGAMYYSCKKLFCFLEILQMI